MEAHGIMGESIPGNGLWVNAGPRARKHAPAHRMSATGWSWCGRRLKGYQQLTAQLTARRCKLCQSRAPETETVIHAAPRRSTRSPLRVYVAGPYADLERIQGVHATLRAAGLRVTSEWANAACSSLDPVTGPAPDQNAAARAWRENRYQIRRSDVLLVIDPDGRGRETYAELGYAIERGLRVIAWAPSTLSTVLPSVTRVDSVADALATMRQGGT